MEVNIKINHALKKYGDNVVIPDLNLDIKPGEFFTLLGPSGCGKTTLLRMIAGFNSIEGGDFYFNDTRINDMEPSKRNIGMVFQNYAIFPHMSVRKNVEFGLVNKKTPKDQIKTISEKYMKLMHIDEYADRMPSQLSGGQQQRVALARALAIEPDVLLMDEPLSNLDAKLRVEMRQVIKEVQQEVGITTVYVTHDQEEAMAVSDRIAVFKGGVIQQIGTPHELYQRPQNTFVAFFIGRSNLLNGKVVHEGGKTFVEFSNGFRQEMTNIIPCEDQEVKISVRPEEFIMSDDGEGIKGTVEQTTFLGISTNYFIRTDNDERVEVNEESQVGKSLQKGDRVCLKVKAHKINVFNKEGSASLIVKEV
ncbi:MAG: ABC transporter ATP-binding protein [Erysipelotrichaceae bacterium]|nr:ABC transporter ATP-binding protein [Erysipelotrichaceae bacterium]